MNVKNEKPWSHRVAIWIIAVLILLGTSWAGARVLFSTRPPEAPTSETASSSSDSPTASSTDEDTGTTDTDSTDGGIVATDGLPVSDTKQSPRQGSSTSDDGNSDDDGTPSEFSPLDVGWANAWWAEGPRFLTEGYDSGAAVPSWPDEVGSSALTGSSDEFENEKQEVRTDGADGGTFTLTFQGQTTAPIGWADYLGVEPALLALSNIEPGDLVITAGGCGNDGCSLTVGAEFAGQYAGTDVGNMVMDKSNLAGDDLQNSRVIVSQEGGVPESTAPIFQSSGLNLMPAVLLPGAPLTLLVDEDLSTTFAGPVSVVMIASLAPSMDDPVPFYQLANDDFGGIFYNLPAGIVGPDPTWAMLDGASESFLLGTPLGGAHLHNHFWNGANSLLEVDGSAQATGDLGTPGSDPYEILQLLQGGTDVPNRIAFFALYPGDVRTDPHWSDFKAWAAEHYGLTIN